MNTNASHRPRALIAMSNPIRRTGLTRALREDDWTVTAVDNGYHLVRRLADVILADDSNRGPDLIVVDATLPGCAGLTVLEGLRQLRWMTPVIVIVDFNKPATLSLANELGASAVFEKPISIPELRAAAAALRPVEPNKRRRRFAGPGRRKQSRA